MIQFTGIATADAEPTDGEGQAHGSGRKGIRALAERGVGGLGRRWRTLHDAPDAGDLPNVENTSLHLQHVIRSCRTAFGMVALFSIGTNLLMLAVPLYMLQVYDRVLATRNVDTLLALTLIAVISIMVLGALEAVRTRLTASVGMWIDRELAGDILDSGISQTLHSRESGGAQGLRDLSSVRGFLSGPGLLPLFDAPFIFVFLAIVFLLHTVLGFIAAAGAAILFSLALLNEFTTRSLVNESNAQNMRAFNEADMAIRNADVIAAMGMGDNLRRRWDEASSAFLGMHGRATHRASGIAAMAKFLRFGIQIALLGSGAFLVTIGEMTGGVMIAASIIGGRALAPIEQSIGGWRALLTAQSAYKRVKQRLNQLASMPQPKMTLPDPTGILEVEGLTYLAPSTGEPILRGVTLDLEPGQALGVIGPTSAGKSTLARNLVGSLAPTRGHVRLDGADLTNWNAIDRGRHIGYVPQDVELFNGTVRENIARMGRAEDVEVVAAAKLAGVHDMILRLPHGYDTVIGDGNFVLSGGRRQRLALARAVFGNPKLLVLDEPNSNLDTEGEQALIETLSSLKEAGTTVVMVSHRPSIMARMDKLLVLVDGMIQRYGTREEIAAELRGPVSVKSVGNDQQNSADNSSEPPPKAAGGDAP